MSDRYSKVSRRTWGDEKFRKLSQLQPSGQGLWLRLLTAPEQNCIPGLYRAWEAGLAQSLGWPLKAFRDAFHEVMVQGMADADWSAGLVWLPNACEHNPPLSLNVIKRWRREWDELPECLLKFRALVRLQAFADGLSDAFRDAFRDAFADVIEDAIGKASAIPTGYACARTRAGDAALVSEISHSEIGGSDQPTKSDQGDPWGLTPPGEKRNGRRKWPPSKRVPEDWQPNEKHRDLATDELRDFDRELALFRDCEFPKAHTDWDAAFRTWLRSTFGHRAPAPAAQRSISLDEAMR